LRLRFIVGSLIALVAVAAESHAADRFWGNQFGGTFIDPFNWQDGLVPGAGDIAHFGLTTNPTLLQRIYTVSFTADATNQALKIEDDFVTFDLDGRTYTTTSVTGNEIGSVAGRSGRLTIKGGIMNVAPDSELLIGVVTNASGSLTVSTGGQLTGWRFLRVGRAGSGILTVQNGGVIQGTLTVIGDASGATGVATITGAGSALNSTILDVGSFGSGTLNITTDGVVRSVINDSVGSQALSTGTVNVDGPNSQWISSGDVALGVCGSGTLNITNGGRVQNTVGGVGLFSGSTGIVNVDGLNSQWINSSFLVSGSGGSGTVKITNGGRVQNTDGFVGGGLGGAGTVNVGGFQAEWINSGELTVGHIGQGTLFITVGGQVRNTNGFIGAGEIALDEFGVGEVIVRGPGSNWTNNGFLSVGHLGRGTLRIEAGGSVSSSSGFIGTFTGSNGTANVTGVGSTWTNSNALVVGSEGLGTLTIEDGGSVASSGGGVSTVGTLIGHFRKSNGTATVTRAGSIWTIDGDLPVGERGSGTLTIESGGSVSSTGGFIGKSSGSDGTATVTGAGSNWTMTGPLSIGGSAQTGINGGTGTLTVGPDGSVSVDQDIVLFNQGLLQLEGGALGAGEISFQGGGQFQWTSGTLHVGLYNDSLVNPGGVLAPGRSAGSTTIMGNYTQQTGGKLEIEIGGLLPGITHDLVDVTGSALLGGELQLAILNGFVPALGSTFTVLKAAGGIVGVFANVANGQRLTTVDGIGSFLVHYGPGSALPQNQIILTDFEFTRGDCDHDGAVDLDDFAPFPDCLGGPDVLSGPIECGCFDLNADDDVDLFDFGLFQTGLTAP